MTRTEFFRFRTGVSGLTDDELLLLDALFQYPGARLGFFFRHQFEVGLNLPVAPVFPKC